MLAKKHSELPEYSERMHAAVIGAIDRERIDPANLLIALADYYVSVAVLRGVDLEFCLSDIAATYERARAIVGKRGGKPYSASAVKSMLGEVYLGRRPARRKS